MTNFLTAMIIQPRRAFMGRVASAIAIGSVLSATPVSAQQAAQPKIRILTEAEIDDMIVGVGVYCSRGFATQANMDRIHAAFAAGKVFKMIAPADMPDDWMGFTTFGIGGGGAWPEVAKRYEGTNVMVDRSTLAPEKVLGDYVGKTFQVTFSAEAGQLVGSLMTAARLDIPLMDGDNSARCLPEVQMSPFYFNDGITRAPFAGVTAFGDEFIVPKVHDDFRTEDITRALAVGSGGGVTIAAHALPASVLRNYVVQGFHSQAGSVGRAAREAVAAGKDPVEAVAKAGKGYVLFRGKVTASDTKGEKGFGWTEATLAGTGQYAGSTYRIYNKNENMVAWRDGKMDAAAPDIIAALDPKTGWAMRGSPTVIGGFVIGEDLAIVGIPAAPLWRTKAAIEGLGPRHFGFDLDYVPVEQLHGKSKK